MKVKGPKKKKCLQDNDANEANREKELNFRAITRDTKRGMDGDKIMSVPNSEPLSLNKV